MCIRDRDKLEGPQYAARRAELRREAGEAARARDRQAAVALQNEAEESGATEEEASSDGRENDESRKTAGWHEGCSENRRQTTKRDRKRQTPKGGRRLAPHSLLLKKIPVWWRFGLGVDFQQVQGRFLETNSSWTPPNFQEISGKLINHKHTCAGEFYYTYTSRELHV